MIGLGLSLWSSCIAPTGAGRLLGSELNGLAIDFLDMSMVVRDTTTPANAFVDGPNAKLTYTSPAAKVILNASGALTSGTTLRTEYNAAGVPLGLRVEEQRTNLFLNSRSAATQTITVVNATSYTVSFYGTGSITFSGANSSTLSGTGASNRVSTTFTTSSTSLTCTVSGSIDYVQVEAGGSTTSPIVTAGSTVVRSADSISLAASAFPSLSAGYTIFAEFVQLTTNSQDILTLKGASGLNEVGGIGTGSPTQIYAENRSGASTNAQFISTVTYGNVQKAAMGVDASNGFASVNGGTTTQDNSVAIPTFTTLLLGTAGYSSNSIVKYLRRVMVLPRRMTNSELQALTA